MRSRMIIFGAAVLYCGTAGSTMGANINRKATFPPVAGKPYTISSYKYTNDSVPRRSHEALAAPITVSDATGTETLHTKLDFIPSDIHIEYKFANRSLTLVIHNVWKEDTKGGTFKWKWMKPENEDFPRWRVCDKRNADGSLAERTCCTNDASLFGCQDAEPCSSETCALGMDPEGADEPVGGAIPTVSEWGLVVMTLLGVTIGTIIFARRRMRGTASTG